MREALEPSSTKNNQGERCHGRDIRSPEPCLHLTKDWVIRRLSPESHKIAIDQIGDHVQA